MPKVYLDEIDAFLSSGTTDILTKDSTESNNVNEAIMEFVDLSKGKLVGTNWDGYRNKFSALNKAIQTRISLAKKLGAAIQEALQLLKDYLGEDQMLDTSQLQEYKKQRDICQNSIDNLNAMLTETTEVRYTDENGQTRITTTALYDANEVRAQISQAQETLKELDRLITKIEGLDAVYSQAEAILQTAFSGIASFQSEVESVVPDATYSYKRA